MLQLRSNYFQAILWFTLSLVISSSNDAITKYIGIYISPWQVAFFRCFFGTLFLLPVMLYHGVATFKTQRLWLHLLRGGLLFIAMSLWTHGMQLAPIATATMMSFTVPIFVLLLAPIFLQERVTKKLWLATLGSFGGIVLVLNPSQTTFQSASLFFILAALLFGLLDVVNKKYVTQEPMLCMLFYSNLVASLLLALPAFYAVSHPGKDDLVLLGLLGIGSNLILFFLLRAFALTDASSLAPLRYLELLISIGLGYVLFQEVPTGYSYLGAAVIIPCTFIATRASKSAD